MGYKADHPVSSPGRPRLRALQAEIGDKTTKLGQKPARDEFGILAYLTDRITLG